MINLQEPEIELKKDNLIIDMARDQTTLYNLQSQILSQLTETNEDSEEAILDNNQLIENLEFSKIKSQNVKENII